MIDLVAFVVVIGPLMLGSWDVWTDWRKRKRIVPMQRGGTETMARRGMSARAKTSAFLIAVIVAILAWEAFAILVLKGDSTVSAVYWSARQDFPLDFFLGFLSAHFVWQRRKCKWCGQDPAA